MLWSEQIESWRSGNCLSYPSNIKSQFLWETSPIYKDKDTNYEEEFIICKQLDNQVNDYSSFSEHIHKSKDSNVVSFFNLSKTSKLIAPMPKNKDYTSIKLFIDNADKEQQISFWKKIAEEIDNILINNDKIWVSTHGLGVPYLHVRIDTFPKYYHTKKFK